jgi:hypothetical protein
VARQPYTPPPRIDPALLRPRRGWYAVAGVVWVAGVGAAVALFVTTILLATGPFTEFDAPGGTTVELDAGDERGIYVQTEGSPLGTVAAPSASDLGCTVVSARGARMVPGSVGGITLSSGGDEYVGRLRFEASESGRYRVDCRPTRRLPLAVGPKVTGLELVLRIGAMFAGGVVGLGGAGAIVLLVYLRREAHKRRLQRDAAARAFGRD